jgi:hypothetical protein
MNEEGRTKNEERGMRNEEEGEERCMMEWRKVVRRGREEDEGKRGIKAGGIGASRRLTAGPRDGR